MSAEKYPVKKGFKKLNVRIIGAGLVAGLFGCTGSALLVINAADNLNLTQIDTISWLFSIYFFGGLIGVILSHKYKIPISGAYTIAGTALLLGNSNNYLLEELAGAYLISGVIILLTGISGLNEKLINRLPEPIIMSMVSGVLTRFILSMMEQIITDITIAIIVILTFLILPQFFKKIPAIIIALIIGIASSVVLNRLSINNISLEFVFPRLVLPIFDLSSVISISIPLSILIMGSENAQAIGVLKFQGYKPPIRNMTIASGIGSIAASLFGGHAANIAGPMTAICSSEEAGENKHDRYLASIINGLIFIIFGVFASFSLKLISILPQSFISLIAVLSMLSVSINSYSQTFSSSKFKVGSMFSFIITLSNISLFNIGAPVWALIIGTFVSIISERDDF